jgi:hypothetical protein
MTTITYPPNTYTIGSCGGGGSGGAGSTVTGIGAIGTSGYIVTSPNTTAFPSTPIYTTSNQFNHANIRVMGNNPTVSTDKNNINLDELAEIMRVMRERFLIIVPDFEKHEKYEALKKAYDHYKLLEAMVMGDKK